MYSSDCPESDTNLRCHCVGASCGRRDGLETRHPTMSQFPVSVSRVMFCDNPATLGENQRFLSRLTPLGEVNMNTDYFNYSPFSQLSKYWSHFVHKIHIFKTF